MKGGEGLKKGLWSEEEDRVLMEHIKVHGKGRWNRVAKITVWVSGLKRCGKSCRLRWMNYLRPEINRGAFSGEEDELIIRLHRLLGNRWSWIAGRVPGRTDNQVKNHWNTHLKKRVFSSTKNSIASELTESINVAEQVSSNACQKMEDQKTMCTQQALNCREEEEFESWSWLWSNNGCNEPWDWFGHDSS